MSSGIQIQFGSFRLEVGEERLWKGGELVPLRRKAFSMLRHLLEHAGSLVSKDELLDAVWPETHVGEAVLKVSMQEIRRALGDPAGKPEFVETVHRRGYRFLAPVTMSGGPEAGESVSLGLTRARLCPEKRTPALIEREGELGELDGLLERVLRGERRVAFVTGEPGIGKSAVVEAFLRRAAGHPNLWIAVGQCLEHHGSGEAYLPVLEALGHLSRQPGGERLVRLLRIHAPTWLAEMPELLAENERRELEREARGASRERMLREMAEMLEAASRETTLVLVLEDLHWCDYSTLDLLAALARRRGPARLLVVGTYRPVDVIVSEHPLKTVKQELALHRLCEEVALGCLSEEGVMQYLTQRFPEHDLPAELAGLIYQRTDGNPLFVLNVVEDLLARRMLRERDGKWRLCAELHEIEVGVPETIREMVEKQLERLEDEDQRVLEAASMAGTHFSASAVAAALGQDLVHIEERCDAFARRRHFLRRMGVGFPEERRLAARFEFIHSLYPRTIAERVPTARRRELHRRIGAHGESAYGSRAAAVAAELARHFEEGGELGKAVHHLRQAAANAERKHAHHEVADLLEHALELVERCPAAERESLRIDLLEQRGLALRSRGDMPAAAADFEAAAGLAEAIGRPDDRLNQLLNLASTLLWFDRPRCHALAEQAAGLARASGDPALRVHALGLCAAWLLELGGWKEEYFRDCLAATEAARRANDRAASSLHLGNLTYFELHRSEYVAACRVAEEGIVHARDCADAYAAFACQMGRSWALFGMGDWGRMLRLDREASVKARQNGQHLAARMIGVGTSMLRQEVFDFERARREAEETRKDCQEAFYSYGMVLSLVLLSRSLLGLGRLDEALGCFEQIDEWNPTVPIDWLIQMPLQQGRSDYWLAKKKYDRAREHALQVCALAAQSQERTYLGLGHRLLAEIAMAERDAKAAEEAVSRAMAAVDGGQVPLAEWRVCETAARCADSRRRSKEARQLWSRSASVLRRLADSLLETPEFRESMLSAAPVREIFRRATRDANV